MQAAQQLDPVPGEVQEAQLAQRAQQRRRLDLVVAEVERAEREGLDTVGATQFVVAGREYPQVTALLYALWVTERSII